MDDIPAKFEALLKSLDTLTSASQAAFGDAVQCRKGCAMCCHGLFDIGVLDALLLHQGWRKLPSPMRADIEKKAEEYLLAINQIRPAWAFPHHLAEIDEAELDDLLARIGMVPCPVLGKDLGCQLYAQRPFYCRVHGLKIRDERTPEADMNTDCELNFQSGTPPRKAWPAHNFSALFEAEGRLIVEAGLDPDGRFLIPAVVTRRFGVLLNLDPAELEEGT
jgi:Fe-S-cluster containining protein